MATGFEDWIIYRTTNAPLALDRLKAHMQALMEQASGPKTISDGVLFDPMSLMELLKADGFLITEMNRLEAVVNGVGVPRFQPTRRVDGGVYAAPDTGVAGGF